MISQIPRSLGPFLDEPGFPPGGHAANRPDILNLESFYFQLVSKAQRSRWMAEGGPGSISPRRNEG